VFGVIGWPVRHSLSPAMHNAAFRHLGLDCCYLPFAVSPEHLSRAIEAVLPLGFGGINVTVPHKESVIPFLHEITPDASLIGAVNTVEVVGDRLVGHNTDGDGFLRALEEEGISVVGRNILVLGAGGSARSVAVRMAASGVSTLVLANRTEERALMLRDLLCARFPSVRIRVCGLEPDSLRKELEETDMVVNTTSVGLKPEDPILIPPEVLRPSMVVYDLIYNPPETPLLKAARAAGAKAVHGLGMLLHQGALAFEIWTGKKAPVEVMRQALTQELKSHGRF